MKRSQNGRGLFYTRDSGGKHETTPAEYVRWACGKAQGLHLQFNGTPEAIDAMIRSGESHRGDLFLDFDVAGDLLSRPGLDRLLAEVKNDPSVSHVMIPRRDRFARPDDPLDALVLEASIRRAGAFLVYMDRILSPLTKGGRPEFEEQLMGLIDYHRAEQEVSDLSEKMIYMQIALARSGWSIGGRPLYGFRRWLVTCDGTKIRQLEDRERVRQPGHHVVWLPVPDDHPEMIVIRRILEMLVTMPASRVAATLNAEGIPSPNAGRWRKKKKVPYPVRGLWLRSTITSIARNRLLVAICTVGRRAEGKKFRYTPDGPRALEPSDFRQDGKPKVIRNPETSLMVAQGQFNPIVPLNQYQELQAILDQRAGTQRGKPRSRDPSKNPLGGRAFDLNCTWPMYRVPYNDSFQYSCGLYMQSSGQECAHNHIDGPTATRFILSTLKQRLFSATGMAKLKAKLREFAERERNDPGIGADTNANQAALARVEKDLEKVSRNLALADSEAHHRAIAAVYDELRREKVLLEAKIASSKLAVPMTLTIDAEVDAELSLADRLRDLVSDETQLAAVSEAFQMVDVKMFIAFKPVQLKKRVVNKVSHGMVTFGDAPAPIPLYQGPTGRREVKRNVVASVATGPGGDDDSVPPDHVGSGGEGESLGNVDRGD